MSSKMIAVCGSPGSGKTSFSLKLCREIYEKTGSARVVYLSPDLEVPAFGYIFPMRKDVELHSMGKIIDKTDIYREDVLKQFVNVRDAGNFALLGFRLGENKYSYPEPTEDKIGQLFNVLAGETDYVIVDCTCREEDLISRLAKRDCDAAIQLVNPDIKSMVYYASCVNRFISVNDKKIVVMNVIDDDICLPVEETGAFYGNVAFTLPYSYALKQQMITGTLTDRLNDSDYRGAVAGIAKKVL